MYCGVASCSNQLVIMRGRIRQTRGFGNYVGGTRVGVGRDTEERLEERASNKRMKLNTYILEP